MLRKSSRTRDEFTALIESREEKQNGYMLSDLVSSRRNVSSGFLQGHSIARHEYAEVGEAVTSDSGGPLPRGETNERPIEGRSMESTRRKKNNLYILL
jgi:hypothetical protein